MASSPTDLPFRPLDDAGFLALRTAFAEHGFTEAGVCRHLGLDSLFDFTPRAAAAATEARALDVLIRLFLESRTLPLADIDTALGADLRALLERAGLLHAPPHDVTLRAATVLLYPTAGPWIASDLTSRVSRSERATPGDADAPNDAVYPALTDSVRVFLSALPVAEGARYLELCSGTGIAALIGAAHGAREAVAVDITARSTAFAAFNARLNGLGNVRAVEGDLYAPVAGERFDIIVAHPPYVPAPQTEYIYRDGGDDGEQVTRAILGGLGEHLAPGGVFQCTCIISSRAGQPAPERVRAMLGDASPAFDLLHLRNGESRLVDQLRRRLLSDNDDARRTAHATLTRLRALEVESIDFCTIILRRHGASRPGISRVVQRTSETTWERIAWALDIGDAALDRETFVDRLLDARVQLSPAARLTTTWRVGASGEEPWVAERGTLETAVPFEAAVDVGMADASLLGRFDGARTLRAHVAELRAEGVLPPDTDPRVFAHGFSHLVLSGLVLSEAYPLP